MIMKAWSFRTTAHNDYSHRISFLVGSLASWPMMNKNPSICMWPPLAMIKKLIAEQHEIREIRFSFLVTGLLTMLAKNANRLILILPSSFERKRKRKSCSRVLHWLTIILPTLMQQCYTHRSCEADRQTYKRMNIRDQKKILRSSMTSSNGETIGQSRQRLIEIFLNHNIK